MSEQIWTIKDVIDWSIPFLKEKGSPSARLDAELLLCDVLACRRLDLYLDHHKPLNNDERSAFRDRIRRRSQGEPVAYILGRKEFHGHEFRVGPATLIPRPETEHLVELVLNSFPDDTEVTGLDVGTGTGCIAISLKKARPHWNLTAWDISRDALQVAAQNAEKLEAPITLEHKDALKDQSWAEARQAFDFIASNPPYIAPAERTELPVSVVRFEPALALFADESGLIFYRTLAQKAAQSLRKGGKIFLEIGSSQASDVCLLLEESGWQNIAVHQDLAGLDRVVTATAPLT
ncbi:peptide chain release factor N(5)-glutamine methyltransferase [Oligoflexus tunisiensis]|uniref:peptide chain release factor N(5)-glutamine methyltransferase n=1 Tax=Oligoflexus tunisiensis TaxID=708132 RepID=UPI000A9107FD|nr:peptide chain release factor N(5)-glutamine methyltransferase [Oligoflexus tunisiensis]